MSSDNGATVAAFLRGRAVNSGPHCWIMDTERILNTLLTLSHHKTPLPFNRTALAEELIGSETGKRYNDRMSHVAAIVSSPLLQCAYSSQAAGQDGCCCL